MTNLLKSYSLRKFAFPVLALSLILLSYFLWIKADVLDNEAPSLFKGILRAPCGGIGEGYLCQAISKIEYRNKKCDMNLFVEKENYHVFWRAEGNVLTSYCFFESKYGEKEFRERFLDKPVSISGKMQNTTVCSLLVKCTEPECVECHEEEILIPSNIS